MTTRAGTGVGKWSPRKGGQQCTSLTSVDAGRRSHGQTSVLSYTYCFSSENGKKPGFHFIPQLLIQSFK